MTKYLKRNLWIYVGSGFSLALIVYCCIYIYSYYSANHIFWKYPKYQIQNTIGDILTPIIGLVASILTFLAFYMQKQANDVLQKQFKIQQFESQFHEMLHLHKENVNEISTRSFSSEKLIEKRAAFESMVSDFNEFLSFSKIGNIPFTRENYNSTYHIFFWGYSDERMKKLSPQAIDILFAHKAFSSPPFPNFSDFKGYASFLGHYFRQLFLLVKFVVESNIVTTYQDKMKYLKMLRAQLSNHEQIILFYNWLSGFGAEWENEQNKFFTEYKMIHNLWVDELFQDAFIIDRVNELEEKPVSFRKGPMLEYREKM